MYFALPTTCSVIFSTFSCREFEETTLGTDGLEHVTVAYQRVDLSTECWRGGEWTDEYRSQVEYATLMIAVYPVGMPLVMFALLRSNRQAIEERETRRGGPELENLSFLFRLYHNEHCEHGINTAATATAATIDRHPYHRRRGRFRHHHTPGHYSTYDLCRRLFLSSVLLALPSVELIFMLSFCVSVWTVLVFREVGPYW